MSNDPHLVAAANAAFPPRADGNLFPRSAVPLSLEITVNQPQARDGKLNLAVNRLIPAALERGQGIRVTEREYGKYTVKVDPEVQCGTTQESRR